VDFPSSANKNLNFKLLEYYFWRFY